MLDFPKYTRTNFQNNFLRSVVFQIKFAKNVEILKQKSKLSNILIDILPNVKEEQSSTLSFQNINNKTQIVPHHDGVTGFTFTSKDSFKILNITDSHITFNIGGQAYSSFESIYTEFEPKLKAITDLFGIKEYNWISIRKINIIQFTLTADGKAYEGLTSIFNNALISQYQSFPSKEYLNSGISNFSLKKDGVNLNLTLGLIPSPNESKDVVFDIDLFCDKEKLNYSQLFAKFAEINQEIFNIFNWSLQDKTIQSLRS